MRVGEFVSWRVRELDSWELVIHQFTNSLIPQLTNSLLVGGEAVEQPGTTGRHQVLLAAAAARMRRVPRRVAAALFVGVAKLRGPGAVARPVVAGVVLAVGVGASVGLRAGEDVVLVGRVADAVDDAALLGERQLLAERAAEARLLDGVAVELAEVLRDALPALVVPRPVADAIPRVDGIRPLRAQIRVPRHAAAAGGGRQRLAVRVGAGEPAVIGAVAFRRAGDEERHRLRRRLLSAALRRRRLPGRSLTGLREHDRGSGEQRSRRGREEFLLLHGGFLLC